MTGRIALLALSALSLIACDATNGALDGTLRDGFVQQCLQVSQSAGIGAGAVNAICECGADRWLEKPASERAQIDPGTVEDILRSCVGTVGGADAPATTENTNG